MTTTTRMLGLPLLLATAVLMGCDGVGPAGPMMDLDDQLMGAQARKTKTSLTTDASTTDTAAEEALAIIDRLHPLKENISITAVVTPKGADLRLWHEAGVWLRVPMGAVDEDTKITLTALAGGKFAIELQPHGLEFNTPVTIYFKKDEASRTDVFGTYFSGSPTDPTFLEFFEIMESNRFLSIGTTHFSGYALASGSRGQKTLSGASF